MKIEKGKRYKCLILNTDTKLLVVGNTYESPDDDYLINEDNKKHWVKFISDQFQLVEEPSTEELLKRIEALEKRVKQYESKAMIKEAFDKVKQSTAAMFKDIADHANAINDIVKNAPKH